jgi:hypothetical protein
MTPETALLLSQLVLAAHLVVILFNVFGLVAIPLGAWRAWPFVRVYWWRALHLVSFAIVAVQSAVGAACFLTIWQAGLREGAGFPASDDPLIQRWVESLIFWPLPIWVFSGLYIGLFVYTLALWRLVPPARRKRPRRQD